MFIRLFQNFRIEGLEQITWLFKFVPKPNRLQHFLFIYGKIKGKESDKKIFIMYYFVTHVFR